MFERGSPVKFVLIFLTLFIAFYYFNIVFFGLTSQGNHYNPYLAHHFNYIVWLRHTLLNCSATLLNWLGYSAITSDTEILVAGHGTLKLIYSCLGLGIMSFFSAFVIAYPKKSKAKLIFLVSGIIVIQILNVTRFVVLAIFWDKNADTQIVDHHTIFNIIIYVIIAISLYFWIKHDDRSTAVYAKN
ncbi:MAG: exosortase Y [Sphingobacteriales bacterium]